MIEIGDLRTALGARLLADLGAEVIRVEPPGGLPDRMEQPFAHREKGPESSLPFLARNAGKLSVVCDVATEEGVDRFKRLVLTADAVIDVSPDPLGRDSEQLGMDWFRARRPRLTWCTVSDFGQTGPRANWKANPLIAFAMSGAMQIAGSADYPPCNAPGPMAYDTASVYAALGVMVALYDVRASGNGRHIDVSVQEAALSGLYPWSIPLYSYSGVVSGRGGTAFTLFPAKDGRIRMMLASERNWDAMWEILGKPDDLDAPELRDRAFRATHPDVVLGLVGRHTREWRATDFVREARRRGIAVSSVQQPGAFPSDPNVQVRGFFERVSHPLLGAIQLPGSPMKVTTVQRAGGMRPPVLGEDNALFREMPR